MPIPHANPFPADALLRGRAAHVLGGTELFGALGARLRVDLVDRKGLTPVGTKPQAIDEPAVLVVLDEAVVVTATTGDAVPLDRGVYLRHREPLFGVQWPGATVRAVGGSPTRVLLLVGRDFDTLPNHVRNALDWGEFQLLSDAYVGP